MATNTPNLNLVKPEMADYADIRVLNGNMDILDSAVGDLDYVKDVAKSDSGLTFTKKDDTQITVPLHYLNLTGGDITGDVNISGTLLVNTKPPLYEIDVVMDDSSPNFYVKSVKYSTGELKQVIVSKNYAGDATVTYPIPFKDTEGLIVTTGAITTGESYQPLYYAVGKSTATGSTIHFENAIGYTYIIEGKWK